MREAVNIKEGLCCEIPKEDRAVDDWSRLGSDAEQFLEELHLEGVKRIV